MIPKPYVTLTAVFSLLISFRILVHEVTGLRSSRIDEPVAENLKTRRFQNYLLQRALNKEGTGDVDITGLEYASESIEPETNPEELPRLIVDYANMIRNNFILLDNSVETRTRKRGNFEKYNQAIPDAPCSCERHREPVDLGEEFYPRLIENRTCSRRMCPEAYECQEKIYNMAVLKRKAYKNEKSPVALPYDLSHRWVEVQQPITIGCLCASDYFKQPNAACSCEYNKIIVDLGEEFYPRIIENRTCNRRMCSEAYRTCQEKIYNMAILKRKAYLYERSSVALPYDLSHRWVEVQMPVTIGCLCK